MITPVNETLKIDEYSIDRICKSFVKNNVSVLALGTTGESPSISMEESCRMVKAVTKSINGKTMVYACLTGNCVDENIEKARQFISAGVDVIVSVLPNYFTLSGSEMYKYYIDLVESIRFPLMIYNIPSTTSMSIPLEIVEELSKHEFILGFKDSERNEDRIFKAIEMFRDREDFSFFVGYAALSASSLRAGADGIIPSTGNFVPGMFRQLYDYSVNGNWEQAERLQNETNEIAQIYQANKSLGESIQALKVMMSEICLCKSFAIPPLIELPESEKEKILEDTRKCVKKFKIDYLKEADFLKFH
jgi:4-hydroxy-tetrahydrodipicolinate synthase